MGIKIYSKTGCTYCKKAKEWFETNQMEYTEIVLDDDQERMYF